MKRKSGFLALVFLAAATAAALFGQDITAWINGVGGKPALAVIDFRGTGAEPYMAAFNSTLFDDLQKSGLFDMKAKSLFPLNNPQRPEDLRSGGNTQGFALSDWGARRSMRPILLSDTQRCRMARSSCTDTWMTLGSRIRNRRS